MEHDAVRPVSQRHTKPDHTGQNTCFSDVIGKDLQDGGGVRRGDQLPPHKNIKNTYICGKLQNTYWTLKEDLRLPKRQDTPHVPGCVADRVLVLQPGVRPEALRWESWVQDIGPPETSQPHVISISESSPRDLCLKVKTQLHSTLELERTHKVNSWSLSRNSVNQKRVAGHI